MAAPADCRVALHPRWLSWTLGAALLVAVIWAALSLTEERAFLRLMQQIEPWWLLLAVALQAGTYVAQGEIWRRVGAAAGQPLSRRTAFELGLVKLFADQALPSAGVSSSVVVAQALEHRRWPTGTALAAVLVNLATYHAAYAGLVGGALTVLWGRGVLPAVVVVAAVAFILFSVLTGAAILVLAGRRRGEPRGPWRRPLLRRAADAMAGADAALVHDPRVIAGGTALQAAIVALDGATIWTLIVAAGTTVSPSDVFAAFMIASLVRTLGIVPGGLGTFEGSAVVMLRAVGVDLAVALSATLAYRGLSFWVPLVPGYVCSRRALGGRQALPSAPAPPFWAMETDALHRRLDSGPGGLSTAEADRRRRVVGPNAQRQPDASSAWSVLLRQVRSPLLLLLVFAAVVSAATGEWLDAAIVLTIVIVSVGIGFAREFRAAAAAAALRARLRASVTVVRDGHAAAGPSEMLVPGDVVLLEAGSLVPADAVVLTAADFFVSEAALTGESFPVQKQPGAVDAATPVRERTNCVFQGTNVRSGTARCLVYATGSATEFGAVARDLRLPTPETEFARGIRHFGYLLSSAMLLMVLLVFAAHMFRGRPPAETLLFAVALAVGLSPELLPAILSVNLSRGARQMATRGVLVRQLDAIENLGSMDVLCTDKTGTLTEGRVTMDGAYDAAGRPSPAVRELGAWNAALETGITSPLDEAIVAAHAPDLAAVRKLGEIPFDFVRKRVTVVVGTREGAQLVTKGAFPQVLDVCSHSADGTLLDTTARAGLERRFEAYTSRGIRVLAVARRAIEERPAYTRDDEHDLHFVGFLTFSDQPKAGVSEALAGLGALGVSVKLVTGDSRLVAQHLAAVVGLRADHVLTGRQLDQLHGEALWRAAGQTDLFVEVDPNQKERIILALKRAGHVVGFLGDGVNDAPAMHAADTSLSVAEAVDVAREAADFVLLDRGLDVIRRGIEEGRRTFANTMKYILTTTSANLGNMASMAGISLFVPFLPLTAGQILINNFLSDVPAVGLAGDRVDPELVARPRRWDMAFIGRYMIEFGVLSSVFDLATFAVLLWGFAAAPAVFRTGWFVESLLTELVVALVVRTERPSFRSRPGRLLLGSTAAMIALALAMPYLPGVAALGFVPLPAPLLGAVVGITVAYVLATEALKAWFYRGTAAASTRRRRR